MKRLNIILDTIKEVFSHLQTRSEGTTQYVIERTKIWKI